MTSIRFIRRGTNKVGNSPHGLVIPTEAAEIAGIERGKYYVFEVKAREVKDLAELEAWQTKKFEVLDDKGRKIHKGKPAPEISKGAVIEPGYTSSEFSTEDAVVAFIVEGRIS